MVGESLDSLGDAWERARRFHFLAPSPSHTGTVFELKPDAFVIESRPDRRRRNLVVVSLLGLVLLSAPIAIGVNGNPWGVPSAILWAFGGFGLLLFGLAMTGSVYQMRLEVTRSGIEKRTRWLRRTKRHRIAPLEVQAIRLVQTHHPKTEDSPAHTEWRVGSLLTSGKTVGLFLDENGERARSVALLVQQLLEEGKKSTVPLLEENDQTMP